MVFLRARWENLILLNYAVERELLAPYLPEGCELDLRDGKPWLSLVAFQFLETRVLGVPWPGFIHFPEVNLRFYVRHREKRAVCFIREYVPSRIVAGMARLLYNEPYSSARMKAEIARKDDLLHVGYSLDQRGHTLRLGVTARAEPMTPPESSVEHFFKEHDLGVGRDRRGKTLTYRVEHPVWRVYPVMNFSAHVSTELYGERFSFLGSRSPDSAFLAEGSAITVSTAE
ncbi:MAG TPA: DUF2071 domain-containing protein [Bdellovibrionota bacterium]|nr:DUF2071 domain-containing protein [Bdellovibrionota bacterium]